MNFAKSILILIVIVTCGETFSKTIVRYAQNLGGPPPATEWSIYLPGAPAVPVMEQPWVYFLSHHPKVCEAPAIQVEQLVKLYDRQVLDGEGIAAANTYQAIEGVVQSNQGPCFQTVAGSLVLSSTFWIENSNMEFRAAPNRGTTRYLKSLLVAALINKSKVHYLTGKTRKNQSKLWNQKTADGTYEILGAYECQTAELFLDLTLRPLDLGATTLHELDHFMRDKATADGTAGAALYNLHAQLYSMQLPQLVLLDEVLSVTYASFLEMTMWPSVIQSPIQHDLTLFSPTGPNRAIWNGYFMNATQGSPIDMEKGEAASFFLKYFTGDFVTSNGEHHRSYVDNPDLHSAISNLYEVVFQSYFPNDPAFDFFQVYNPGYINLGFSIFNQWEWRLHEMAVLNAQQDPNGTRVIHPLDAGHAVYDVLKNLETATPACVGLVRAGANADLKSYIGTQLSNQKPEKGVKGSAHVHPCLNMHTRI